MARDAPEQVRDLSTAKPYTGVMGKVERKPRAVGRIRQRRNAALLWSCIRAAMTGGGLVTAAQEGVWQPNGKTTIAANKGVDSASRPGQRPFAKFI